MSEPVPAETSTLPPTDLEIRVTTRSEGEALALDCVLHSPNGRFELAHVPFPGGHLHRPDAWQQRIFKTLEKLHRSLDSRDTRLTAGEVASELAALGEDLSDELFPKHLQRTLLEVREAETVLLVSDEPWIPWELVKPFEAQGEDDGFLASRQLTRWLPGGRTPAARIDVARLAVVEAGSPPDLQALTRAADELRFLRELAARHRVADESLPEATYPDVLTLLAESDLGLVHFVAHGEHDAEDPETSAIHLCDGRTLRPRDLRRSLRRRLAGNRPLVFLSSCQMGRQGWSLTRLGGWARRFVLDAGCGAFVAPQWTIGDEAAHAFAVAFYEALEGGGTFGEATLAARRALPEGSPGRFAYAVYAHPGARLAFPECNADRPPSSEPRARRRASPESGHTGDPREVVCMAEPPPGDFVGRPDELESLIDLLTAPTDSPVAMAAALRGAGGYGKTTLARAVCHEPRIRAAFPDGILWLTLGEKPRDLVGYVEDLVFILDGEKRSFASLDAAVAHWERRIAERRTLLVLDDVWQGVHLKPFLRGGPRCRRLVTTRDRGVLPAGTRVLEIDAMRQREALELLTAGVPAGNRDACRRLAKRLGHWPLLLRLANGVLRFRLEHLAQGLAEALIYLHRALDERGLTAFDAARPADRHQAVATTLDVSLDQLTTDERARYKELAVFPEDVAVPLATLAILWNDGPRGTLSEALCTRFFQLSLLSGADFAHRFVRLHDVVREYLVNEAGDTLAGLHRRFLRSFLRLLGAEESPGEDGWPWRLLSEDEPYLWAHLAWHLGHAGMARELAATVKDLGFLAGRVARGDLHGAESDVAMARRHLPEDPQLLSLHSTLSHFKHLVLRCTSLTETLSTLYLRVADRPELSEMTQRARRRPEGMLFHPRFPLPDAPHPALIRTFAGHEDSVTDCAISADGGRIASCSSDCTLRVWDAVTGAELLRSEDPGGEVVSCALSADGAVAAALSDTSLRVWDVASGVEMWSLGERDSASGCSLSADARILACAWKKKVAVYSLPGGDLLWQSDLPDTCLGGCVLSRDGSRMITAAGNDLLIWNVRTGKRLRRLTGHEKKVWDCDLSADARIAASASDGGTLRTWDTATGETTIRLSVDEVIAGACALSPEGNRVLTGGQDAELKAWDTRDGRLLARLWGHSGPVDSCAFDAAGQRMLSGGADGTVRLWRWDGVAEADVPHYRRRFIDCVVASDGRLLAGVEADGTLSTWTLASQPAAALGRDRAFRGHSRGGMACCLDQAANRLFSAGMDGTVRAWDLATGEEVAVLIQEREPIWRVALDCSGSVLAAVTSTGQLHLWNSRTLEPVQTLQVGDVSPAGCALSLDAHRLAVASLDQRLLLFELTTDREPRVFEGHGDEVNDCVFSADGQWILSASDDETVRIGDTSSGSLVRVLEGHDGPVRGCALHGHLLAAVALNVHGSTLRLWDVTTGSCPLVLRLDSELDTCSWFPDGTALVAAGEKGLFVFDLVR